MPAAAPNVPAEVSAPPLKAVRKETGERTLANARASNANMKNPMRPLRIGQGGGV